MKREYFVHEKMDEALESVKKHLYFTDEIEMIASDIEEKLREPDLLGKTVKVTEKQFKEVYFCLEDLVKKAGIEMPDLYVYEEFYYGVESKGTVKPWIEISAKTIQDLKIEEIRFLLAREVYNIKDKVTYYKSIYEQFIKTLENGKWIMGMEAALDTLRIKMCQYVRLSNYSADCFGYLMCDDLKISINSILKLVLNSVYLAEEIHIDEYIKQGEKINSLDSIVYEYTKLDEMVPYGPFRVKNLISFASSERAEAAFLSFNN